MSIEFQRTRWCTSR